MELPSAALESRLLELSAFSSGPRPVCATFALVAEKGRKIGESVDARESTLSSNFSGRQRPGLV